MPHSLHLLWSVSLMDLILFVSHLCACQTANGSLLSATLKTWCYTQVSSGGELAETDGQMLEGWGETHLCWCLKSVTWQLSYSVGSAHCHRSKITFNVLMLREITQRSRSYKQRTGAVIKVHFPLHFLLCLCLKCNRVAVSHWNWTRFIKQ